MRPPVPDLAQPPSRKPSLDHHLHHHQRIDPRTSVPTTFFLSRNSSPDSLRPPSDVPLAPHESMFGIQSFEDAASSPLSPPDPVSAPLSPTPGHRTTQGDCRLDDSSLDHPVPDQLPRHQSKLSPYDILHSDRPDISFSPSDPSSSRPLTPLNLSNPGDPSSLPSSPKSISIQSMRNLDELSFTDDLSSQAVGSAEEDDPEPRPSPNLGNHASQLIMPSITMPSRRPFTDRGKNLGRLKVLFAGASGSGKTSLIRSIVQTCHDIVHVDPFPSPPPPPSFRSSRSATQTDMPSSVSEVYASTKPYPTWWSDLEDSRILRRRKSTGDVVLERNICFVDTPATSLRRAGQTDAILQYIQQQLLRATSALNSSNHDFQNMLAGNGGSQVDVVLYFISIETLPTDIQCIQKLCDWTNVVPIISKTDLLTSDQISSLKSAFHKEAQVTPIKPFVFESNIPEGTDIPEPQAPFTVSSAMANDDDVMDASTLMSPDYVQPLIVSELGFLVEKIFNVENMAWLRHSAAKKLSQRRQEPPLRWQGTLQAGPLSTIPNAPSCSPTYTTSRLSDYTQYEERMARVQLAKWASDLQRSLQNERERYAALARGERAVWLTERLGECVVDGSLVPITQTPGFRGLRGPTEKTADKGSGFVVRAQNGQKVEYHLAQISPQDPLGLVRWSDNFKCRGWTIVQIVGSFGVIGGLALWLTEWRFLTGYGSSN